MLQVGLKNMGTVNKNMVSLSKECGGHVASGHYMVALVLWFSYQTCVGFHLLGGRFDKKVVRQNDWSTTTGKLLNELEPNKEARVIGKDFEEALSLAFKCFENAQ